MWYGDAYYDGLGIAAAFAGRRSGLRRHVANEPISRRVSKEGRRRSGEWGSQVVPARWFNRARLRVESPISALVTCNLNRVLLLVMPACSVKE